MYFRLRVYVLLISGCLAFMLPALAFGAAARDAQAQGVDNEWQIGNIVYLSAGTQIRQAPTVDSCYHTIVPEDDWAVKVTGGPRFADGRTWYDTSREEAGDASGGTGWVNVEQADLRPAPNDGGTLCAGSDNLAMPTPTATAGEKAGFQVETPGFLLDLKSWWVSQSIILKIGIVVVALVLLLGTGRFAGKDAANALIFGVIRAGLAGIILGGAADLTRVYWQETWLRIAGSAGGLDPALILLVAPLAWALVSFVLNTVGRVLGLILAAIQILLLLMYIAPDRFNGILDGVVGIFTGAK